MASTLDKITDTRNAARPNSARVSSGRSAGGTTLACDNLTGWPTASKVHFVIYQIDSNSNPVAGTQLDCSGIVSGNNIGSFTVIDGADTGNNVGDVVEMLPTAAWGQDLADALMVSHDRDGSLKDSIVVTAKLANDAVTTSKIPDLAVTTGKINDNAVTAAKTEELPLATQRQANATATTVADPVLKYGWAQLTATTAKTQTYALTFGTAFDNVPIVTVSIAGYKTAGATDVNAGTALNLDCISAYAENIATTGCTLRAIASSANLPNVDLLVTWHAIGTKAR